MKFDVYNIFIDNYCFNTSLKFYVFNIFIDHYCFDTSLTSVDVSQSVWGKEKKLGHLSDLSGTCHTSVLRLSHTDTCWTGIYV